MLIVIHCTWLRDKLKSIFFRKKEVIGSNRIFKILTILYLKLVKLEIYIIRRLERMDLCNCYAGHKI